MRTQEVIKQLDALLEANKVQEAGALLEDSLRQAMEEHDDGALLVLLNEMIGYKRELGEAEESYRYAEAALKLLEGVDVSSEGKVYATTLLNVANAYRAGGRLEESLALYEKVRPVYERCIPGDDMLFASYYNNISLLYQEMQEFGTAKEYLLRALAIVTGKEGMWYEEAVTLTNLAATRLNLDEDGDAWEEAGKARSIFEEHGVQDSHCAAALASMGSCLYRQGRFEEAAGQYERAMQMMKASLGENEYYRRLSENLAACRRAQAAREGEKGLALCREYYEAFGRPMIREQFADYEDKIAVGLCGEGSDCLGFDDAYSQDHDWGPGFCLWLTESVYEEIGERLQKAYEALPAEYKGFKRRDTAMGSARTGVCTVGDFYKRILGEENCLRIAADMKEGDLRFDRIADEALCAAVSGEVFCDGDGTFSAVRRFLQGGFPERIKYLKVAEAMARFSQGAQYNFLRMETRGDHAAARLALTEGLRQAMKLLYYAQNAYPPHDKWLCEGLRSLGGCEEELALIDDLARAGLCGEETGRLAEEAEQLAALLCDRFYVLDYISVRESYLGYHAAELLKKAELAEKTDEELIDAVAKIEYDAFDKVQNEGGRASCQNDWKTFEIMRKSQYGTWKRKMLIQYLYDFEREYAKGRNLIQEKYGRMMESTAPEAYERIRDGLPKLDPEKQRIIEAIVQLQVGFMEEFAGRYPELSKNARLIHTYEDANGETSYETYLRGELGTYSDKMLVLYGRFVAELAREGENLALLTMENTVRMYGYRTLEDAQRANAPAADDRK